MSESTNTIGGRLSLPAFFGWAAALFKSPHAFFDRMERGGGYLTPCLYLAGWALLSSIVSFLVSLTRPVPAELVGGRAAQLVGIVITPIGALIMAFALIGVYLFAIWHVMGSKENFQTAFRVWAFIAPVGVLTAALGVVPYLPTLGILYTLYLIVVASQRVHGISAERSWTVWGVLGGVLLLAIVATIASRSFLQGGLASRRPAAFAQ